MNFFYISQTSTKCILYLQFFKAFWQNSDIFNEYFNFIMIQDSGKKHEQFTRNKRPKG